MNLIVIVFNINSVWPYKFRKFYKITHLEGLAKKILITDGHPAYSVIIERICIKHPLCIFHIIKNHHDKTYKE